MREWQQLIVITNNVSYNNDKPAKKKENRDQSSADATMFNEQQRLALRALRAAVKACDDSEHRQRNLY